MINSIKLHSDGACWNHPEHRHMMGMGVAVFIDDEYVDEHSIAWGLDEEGGTNNRAEWLACIGAMKMVRDYRILFPNAKIEVFSDSQIITNQFNGTYKINDAKMVEYKKEAISYVGENTIKVQWVPREQNKQADKLSKAGLQIVKDTVNS